MRKESRIFLFKLRLEGENKEYNGRLPPSSCIQKIYISVIVYIESFLCVKISTFMCCRWFLMGLFSCKNCTSVLYSVGAYFFCYAFLIFYNFSSLTIHFQKGGLYIRLLFPTSIALITGVEKKVHISEAQS